MIGRILNMKIYYQCKLFLDLKGINSQPIFVNSAKCVILISHYFGNKKDIYENSNNWNWWRWWIFRWKTC